jgi:aminoglycoside phosphotransferase (APT) family kinase protein
MMERYPIRGFVVPLPIRYVTDSDSHPGSPPPRTVLRRGLEHVLAAEIAARGPFRITSRRPSPQSSTYLADIVRIRFADGSSERLLCKYSAGVDLDPASPHRGLAHEAAVYDRVLPGAPVSLPHVWGSFHDFDTGEFAVVMRFYDDALSSVQASAEEAAVRWLARLHAWAEPCVTDPSWRILDRYDTAYYERWLTRTCTLAEPLASDFPWLDHVAAAYRERIPLLVAARPTFIHGEFTPRNAMWADGRVLPVDWETAAIGPGEIDLAVFTFDWDLDDLQALESAYVAERWGNAPPATFADTLLAARLYVSFHWIFSGSFRSDLPRIRSHLEGILDEAIRWGIVPRAGLLG